MGIKNIVRNTVLGGVLASTMFINGTEEMSTQYPLETKSTEIGWYNDKVPNEDFRYMFLEDMESTIYFTKEGNRIVPTQEFYDANPNEIFKAVNKSVEDKLTYNKTIFDILAYSENLLGFDNYNPNSKTPNFSTALKEGLDYLTFDYLINGFDADIFSENYENGIGVCHTYATAVVEGWKILKELNPNLKDTDVGYVLNDMNIDFLPSHLNNHSSVVLYDGDEKIYHDPTVNDSDSILSNTLFYPKKGPIETEINEEGTVLKVIQKLYNGKIVTNEYDSETKNIISHKKETSDGYEKTIYDSLNGNKIGQEILNEHGNTHTKWEGELLTYTRHDYFDGNWFERIDEYDEDGNRIKETTTESDGDIFIAEYDETGNRIRQTDTDLNGNRFFTEFNSLTGDRIFEEIIDKDEKHTRRFENGFEIYHLYELHDSSSETTSNRNPNGNLLSRTRIDSDGDKSFTKFNPLTRNKIFEETTNKYSKETKRFENGFEIYELYERDDGFNSETVFNRNSDGDLLSKTRIDSDGDKRFAEYNPLTGNIIFEETTNGNRKIIRRYENGLEIYKLLERDDGFSSETTSNRNPNGNLLSRTRIDSDGDKSFTEYNPLTGNRVFEETTDKYAKETKRFENGFEIYSLYEDDDGTSETTFNRNSDGDLLSKIRIDSDGDKLFIEYNPLTGNRVFKEVIGEYGKHTTTYENDNIIKSTTTYSNGSFRVNHYNKDGDVIKRTRSYPDRGVYVTDYNTDGNKTKTTITYPDGDVYVTKYEYDENGNLIRQTQTQPDGDVRVTEF